MVHCGVQSIRDDLTLAYAGNCIGDAEFVLLYEYNRSKPVFPYWKFNAFNLKTKMTKSVALSYGLARMSSIIDAVFANS